MASRRLSRIIEKSIRSPPSVPAPNPNPNPIDALLLDPSFSSAPDPHPTLSHSPAPPARLARLLRTHLSPSFTPPDLLRLLRRRLRHHPYLAPYDLPLFLSAPAADPSFRHDHHAYLHMAQTLAATARAHLLPFLLHTLIARPCPCSLGGIFSCPQLEPTFRLAIQALTLSGDLPSATNAFESLRRSIDGKPSPALYNILIHAFSKQAQHSKAIDWYHRMLKDRVTPDTYTFNILISGSDLDSAFMWFREMRSKGHNPDVVTFNTLIRGFFKRKKFKEGIGIAREMLDLGYGFSVATLEILTDGLCREGRVREAGELVTDFLKRGAVPEGFDCLGLIEAMCGEGMVGRAMEMVDSMWEKGISMGVPTCTTLIEGLRSAGKMGEACVFVERMLEKGIVPDIITFNCFLEELCDVGRTVDGNRIRVLASRKGLEPDGVTYSVLIRGFSREGRRREGEGVVDEMLDAGFIPNITTYNRLMAGLLKSKKV